MYLHMYVTYIHTYIQVWAALGTAIVTMAGIVLFNEKCDRIKVCSLFMVIIGVVGLNLTEEH